MTCPGPSHGTKNAVEHKSSCLQEHSVVEAACCLSYLHFPLLLVSSTTPVLSEAAMYLAKKLHSPGCFTDTVANKRGIKSYLGVLGKLLKED